MAYLIASGERGIFTMDSLRTFVSFTIEITIFIICNPLQMPKIARGVGSVHYRVMYVISWHVLEGLVSFSSYVLAQIDDSIARE